MVKNAELKIREFLGPPNSAPICGLNLLNIKKAIHIIAKIQKTNTEKPREPGRTKNCVPCVEW